MKAVVLALTFALSAGQATACARSISVFEQFHLLTEVGATFTIVAGHFTLDPVTEGAPLGDGDVLMKGSLDGRTLGPDGESRPYHETVGWTEPVNNGWFQHPLPDRPSVAFVRETENGPAIVTGVCGGGYFLTDAATIKAFETCLEEGSCPAY